MKQNLDVRTASSIAYLSVVASVFGFAMCFYILSNIETTRGSPISLVTLVLVLLIGQAFNDKLNSASVSAVTR